MSEENGNRDGVWFVYDGVCPICKTAAQALRVRENCGPLHLLDARDNADDPLLQDIRRRGLDLDEGMVIVHAGRFHHGRDALLFMARNGGKRGWFNRLNRLVFRTSRAAELSYPLMRAARNALLALRGVAKIGNLIDGEDPIFKSVFGADWDRLPPVMRRHYANRAGRADVVTVEGRLDIESSRVGRLLKPFFFLARTLVPYEGRNVSCTVNFTTGAGGKAFRFDRVFHFPDRRPYHFRSAMIPLGGNEVVERMSFGLCWRLAYRWDGAKVILAHRGYALKLGALLIPLPLALLIGKGYAEEIPLNNDEFSMMTEIRHPWWGRVYGYRGTFRITKDA